MLTTWERRIVRQQGVTLLELMIVVAIVGILAAIAFPAYQGHVQNTRRTDGMSSLLTIMNAQERFYSNQFPPSYTTDLSDLGYPASKVTSDKGYYVVSATACGGGITSCVLLTAVPQEGQADDGNLTLNSLGVRTRDGEDSWD